jgi:dihydrofolate reductase
MKIIVAVDREWNIGYKGDLLFHIPDDMKFFRSRTIGKIVIMGRKTLESFPNSKPLKDRVNIVLSSNPDYTVEGTIVVNNVDELLNKLKEYNSDDEFVIGGEKIYRLLLPYCDTAIITHVDSIAEKADKKFPELSDKEWKISNCSPIHECNGYKFTWCEYNRI